MARDGGTASAATRIAETLHAYGVRFAFGIPGNDVLELIRACESAGIRFILSKSEPSAGFMADAVAQVTGAPATCIFALGPGVVNGATGVAGALMERTPVIVLGGEMASGARGLYTHQVFDHVALMAPVTKWAAELNPARAAQQTAKALDIALTEPRGPVYLNCAADASRADAVEATPRKPVPRALGVSSEETLSSARAVLSKSKRPLALIGLGALRPGVAEPLKAFLESWQIPFFTTFKAKGVVSEKHPLSLGALGLSPIVDAVTLDLVKKADHMTLVGFDPIELRDAWLDAWGEDKAGMTLDWTAQTDRVFPSGDQILGDLPGNLAALGAKADPGVAWPDKRVAVYRKAIADIVAPREPEEGISPAALFASVNERIDESMLMTVDVGAHRILACHALQCVTPGQLLQANGLCSMGYAIPGAIGASLADPGKRIVAMLGDGCALMSLGELAVIAEHDLPVTVIVLNDASLALIELKQSKMQLETGSVRFRSPDFAAIAQGFGIEAVRATTNSEFRDACEKSLAARGPVLIDAVCDAREYWEQM
jgi:acetolactate synthase-1/2/3 large subunit